METTTEDNDVLEQFERCVNAARTADVPYDQLDRLLVQSGYVPYPWQWRFHAAARLCDMEWGPTEIMLGGARGPGKSHAVLSQSALDDCQRVDGLKVLYLRQTGSAAAESFDDLITKAVRGRAAYHKSKQMLKMKNGSRIILGGFKDERDIDKYIGIEYDEIIVEEVTQITLAKYQKLMGSLRTSKPNWRPRIYSTCNPGGIGHTWVRERFVLPYRANKETNTRFIPSTYKENKALNPEYIAYLESLGGDLGKAWREGEWDLFAGQFFSQWRHEVHVCSPFAVPLSWFRYRSIDPGGRNGTTSCHWYAVNPDGRVYVYKEYYWNPKYHDGEGRDIDQHAQEIKKLSEDEDGIQEVYRYTVIDTAAFAHGGLAETVAEVFNRFGVNGLMPSDKERVAGWNTVNTYLRSDDANSHIPLLQVFSTCVNMIRTLPELQHDEKHPEDLDTRGEDHAADELRYFLQGMRATKAPKKESAVERKIRENQTSEAQFDYSYSNSRKIINRRRF